MSQIESLRPNAHVRIGDIHIGPGAEPAFIAGPCVLESRDHARSIAEFLARAAERLDIRLVFKASYDKANRTSIHSYRGPGLDEGLAILRGIREEFGLPVLTDIHAPEQAAPAAEAVDCIQVPAFLCRQTDLLAAAARAGKPVNVKKGQFMAPWDARPLVEKLLEAGARDILLTERGVSFGYNRLVADMAALTVMRELGVPLVFDATHSVQQPGGLGTASGGNRALAAPLARAAAAVGIDALFVEVHDDPDRALSDGPNSLPLGEFDSLVRSVLAISRAAAEAASGA